MKDLRLSEIWIYPIKSLGGIRLTSCKVMPKGLYLDRRWMLVDEQGKFITQRVHHTMALFKLRLEGDQLVVQYQDDTLAIPTTAAAGPTFPVTIWDDTVQAFEVDPAVSTWFAHHLNMSCRLVYFPEDGARPVDPRYHVNHEHVSLADAYPFLIIGQSSLDDLNRRLPSPVPMNRFRPNLVFTGGEAFDEDRWRDFTVGQNRFVGVKPCARCVLTTVDQETGVKGAEPLRTLASYRTVTNKVMFGQNLVARDHTEINVGDLITVQGYL